MYLNAINTLKDISDYTKNKYITDKVSSENLQTDKTYKPNISEEQFSPNRTAINSDDIEQAMRKDFTNLSQWSGFSNMYFQDNTQKIDNLVDTAKKYTKYINENFSGDKKQNYLDSLNGYVDFAKGLISSEISFNIGKFFDLNKNDISDIKNNIGSIIDNKLNNISDTKETTSLKDMNYHDLKSLSAGIDSISKSFEDFYFSADGLNVGSLGMAKMKTNFIVEKTNLSDSIKTKLSERVDNKITEQLDDICKAQEFMQKQRKAKGFLLEDITDEDSSSILKKLKEHVSKTYKKFVNVKFDKDFMNNLLNIMKDSNGQYSDDIDYYKKVDAKQGNGTSKSLPKSQNTSTDKLACDWNNFIDKVYTGDDKSQYYIPSSNHNIVNAFA